MPKTASSDLKVNPADPKSTARYTHDGALIEGTGIGGKVLIV
jgi:alkane 1-monooxygenase